MVLTALLQEAHAADVRGTACLPAGSGLKVTGQRSIVAPQLFKHKEFNFEKLGIGGLDIQFEQIFRRAFASRVFPPAVVERLGIRHVKVGLSDAFSAL